MTYPGLEFRVSAGGAKSWTFRFRDPVSRRTLRFKIGPYPEIGLSVARRRAAQLRGDVATGANPIEAKRSERQEATDRRFEALSDRYLNEHARRHKRPRSIVEDERNLRKHVLPKWGKRDYREIRRRDAIELIEGIVSAGTHTAANRVHQLISKIFSFAMDADLIEANPIARLQKRGKENTGKRVLDDDEIALFWRDIVKPPVSPQVGAALRLALLTAARANEISGIEIRELHDLEGDDPCLLIPADRVKNKRPHLIPLSALAVEVVRSIIDNDQDRKHLFPSTRGPTGRISAHALAVAMSRFCDKLEGNGPAKTMHGDPPSPHDLRRTAATRMSALGIAREDRDAVLNHARVDVGKHYDLYDRLKEKRAALEALANAIQSIIIQKAQA